jgi:hypothetical protein
MVGDVIPSWSPVKGVIEWQPLMKAPIARLIVSLQLNGQKVLAILPPTLKKKLKKIALN